MPEVIPSGLTTFRLRNEGKELHQVMLYRLEAGRTLNNVAAALATSAVVPAWLHAVGGPNSPHPGGGVSNATVSLEPGEYIAFCLMAGADKVGHVSKGMIRTLTVRQVGRPRVAMPSADVTITMREYSYTLSQPLTPGHHVIAVVNAGQQTHDLMFSKLAKGKTSKDYAAWIESPHGTSPVTPMGGTTDVGPGGTALFQVDVEPGSYSLLCHVRDTKDGKPHDAHGMVLDVAVK